MKHAPGWTSSQPIDEPKWRHIQLHFDHHGNLPSFQALEFEISCAAPVNDPTAKVGILAMAFAAGKGRTLAIHVPATAATLREYAAALLRTAAQVDDGVGLQ